MSVTGSLGVARALKKELSDKIHELGLRGVIQLRHSHKPFFFLGWEVSAPQTSFFRPEKKFHIRGVNLVTKARKIRPRLRFRAPLSYLYNWFGQQGFFR